MKLRIADNLALPLEAVTESLGILAVKRAGKSHTAKLLTEQLHKAGQQIVIVDPKGDWWGIRSSADGKGPGLPIVIVGGEHGDVPLEPGAGEVVARLAGVERASVLLDLSELRKYEVATFMTAFLETLYRLKAKDEYRTPMMLMIDEADAIAPQRPQKGEERMLGAAEDIVRRGGQRGIGITLVSQRAAVLNKNVLTQVGILILLRTTGSQDIDAINEWIRKHAQEEKRAQVMATIAAQPRGTAWVWAPGWPDERGIFRQVEILPIDTFDSGATPKPGVQRTVPKTVADVDLDAFRRDMAATIEKAKAEDPRELRRRIAELERQLIEARRDVPVTVPEPQIVRVEALTEAHVAEIDRQSARLESAGEGLRRVADDVLKAGTSLRDELHAVLARQEAALAPSRRTLATPAQPVRVVRPEPRATRSRATVADTGPVSRYAQSLLDAMARFEALGQREVSRRHVAALAGKSPRSSAFDGEVAKLRGADLVEYGAGGALRLTDRGRRHAAPAERPASRDELIEAYKRHVLSDYEGRLFDVIVAAHGRMLDRATIAERAGQSARSSQFDAALASMRGLGLIEYGSGGTVRLGDEVS